MFLLSFSKMVLPVTLMLVIALVIWIVPVVMEVVLVDQEAVGAHQNWVCVRRCSEQLLLQDLHHLHLQDLMWRKTLLMKKKTLLMGGAVASWLVGSSPDRAVRIRALAGDIVLCSWARHLTLTVPLSTQVYKWVPANLMLGVTLQWTSIPSRGE